MNERRTTWRWKRHNVIFGPDLSFENQVYRSCSASYSTSFAAFNKSVGPKVTGYWVCDCFRLRWRSRLPVSTRVGMDCCNTHVQLALAGFPKYATDKLQDVSNISAGIASGTQYPEAFFIHPISVLLTHESTNYPHDMQTLFSRYSNVYCTVEITFACNVVST